MEGAAEESSRREEGARTVEEQRHVIRVGLGGGVGLHRAPLLPLLLLLLGRLGKLLGRLRLGPGEAHPLLMSRSDDRAALLRRRSLPLCAQHIRALPALRSTGRFQPCHLSVCHLSVCHSSSGNRACGNLL